MQSKTILYRSAKIFYRSFGKGSPLVLIHGFAEDGDIWENQVKFLKDRLTAGKAGFHLIVPDLPGSGRSAMIEDMSMEGMADLIKEIIDIEFKKFPRQLAGVGRVSMAGHSMGGYITLAFAEKYPDLLSSISLVHSSAFADTDEKKAVRLKSIEFVKKHGAFEFLKATITDLFTESWSSNNKEPVGRQIEKSRLFTDEAIIQYYHAMINRPDRTSVLKNFSNPIQFIIGEHDMAVPFQQSMQQCYIPDRSYIHILRQSAHMGMLEEAEKVNKAFLELN